LEKAVAQRKPFSLAGIFKGNEQPYRGEIFEDSFKIIRNIGYRNSFVPIIKGKIIDNYPGTVIEVKMRMMIFVYIFMLVWFGGISIGLMFALKGAILAAIVPLGMLAFGYLIVMVGYKYEVNKAKKFLVNLFGEQKFMLDNRTPMEDLFDRLIKKK
jgi:hypothetical protein